MKRVVWLCVGIFLFAGLATGQSLGDVARKQRRQKKPPASKVYTNDNLPTSAPINIGATTAGADEKSADKSGENTDQKAAEDKTKRFTEFKRRVDEQNKSITLLERELDVLQREYKQQIALYYADAGNQLRDSRKWADQQRKYESDIAAKQKELDDARVKLDDVREEARKAGVPSSIVE